MEKIEHVAVDLGYGYVKAISSRTGKRVVFPTLVGRGHDLSLSGVFGSKKNDIENISVTYRGEKYFVGKLAESESRSVSRVFEKKRFNHQYTKLLLNVAILLVTDGTVNEVNLSTGLPLDFYNQQKEQFKRSVIGLQPSVKWNNGSFKGQEMAININDAVVLPQGVSAIFSALVNQEGKYAYPDLMKSGNLIALIDIGFRTTDYIVIEIQDDGSFHPNTGLSGTIDEGVSGLHYQVRQHYKSITGGSELNEYHLSRILKSKNIAIKGRNVDFTNHIQSSKSEITNNIADQLKSVWAEQFELFNAIFLAGGGGKLFNEEIQKHFNNRAEIISDSQYANAIGYLRIGKRFFI